jgi:hypothetical protein
VDCGAILRMFLELLDVIVSRPHLLNQLVVATTRSRWLDPKCPHQVIDQRGSETYDHFQFSMRCTRPISAHSTYNDCLHKAKLFCNNCAQNSAKRASWPVVWIRMKRSPLYIYTYIYYIHIVPYKTTWKMLDDLARKQWGMMMLAYHLKSWIATGMADHSSAAIQLS